MTASVKQLLDDLASIKQVLADYAGKRDAIDADLRTQLADALKSADLYHVTATELQAGIDAAFDAAEAAKASLAPPTDTPAASDQPAP